MEQIRKVTAEKLYVRVLTPDLSVFDGAKGAEHHEKLIEILAETQWDGELGVAVEARDQCYPLFGLDVPEKRLGAEYVR